MHLLIVLGRREPALSGAKGFFQSIGKNIKNIAKDIARVVASVVKPSGSGDTR